jgi:CRP-like cAMP-binding protein
MGNLKLDNICSSWEIRYQLNIYSRQVATSLLREVKLKLGPGQPFGELALLYNAPQSASVGAVTNCGFWILDRRSLLNRGNPCQSFLREQAVNGRGAIFLLHDPDVTGCY